MDDMMTKIVEGAVKRLKDGLGGGDPSKPGPRVSEFDISKDFGNIISWPSIAAVIEKIGVEQTTGLMDRADGWEFRPVLSIYMVFKAVQPTPRREGIYPLVTAAAALLLGQTFGLPIEPLEPDGPIIEIVNEALIRTGAVCFKMDLKSAFSVDLSEGGEDMERLLVTANTYRYKEWESGEQVIEHENDREV